VRGHDKSSIRRRVRVTNALGLHMRAAGRFARLAQEFQAEVRVGLDGKAARGKSLLDLMTLAALVGLVESRFDEADEG
jgi:phosphocarrier protein HPr